MKKFLSVFLVLALIAGVPGLWAKSTSSGRSFGSSGFKSIQKLNLPRTSTNSTTGLTNSRPTTVMPYYAPPVFFWMPMPGAGVAPAGAGQGWVILLLVVGGVVVFVALSRRRVTAGADASEDEELRLLFERCQKNLEHLTQQYLEAQKWLERLDGKIPASQWKDWNDRYTRIRLDDFQRQLDEVQAHMKRGEALSARTKLFSFDEDAVAVFEFFQEIENTVEDVG